MMIEEIPNPIHTCDFCGLESIQDMPWEYPCEDFHSSITHAWYIGPWAACEPCYMAIEKLDWADVAMRSAINHPLVIEGTMSVLHALEFIILIHSDFRKHRSGPVRKLEVI